MTQKPDRIRISDNPQRISLNIQIARKGAKILNVIVHYPKSTRDIAVLQNKVAAVHADAVLRHIQNLPCSQEQRHKMLDEIKKACRDLR